MKYTCHSTDHSLWEHLQVALEDLLNPGRIFDGQTLMPPIKVKVEIG